MANELLYVPGVGSRYYYNQTSGAVSLDKIGSGWTSALESGRPALAFNGAAAFKFTFGSGMTGSHTIEYWLKLDGWNNSGTSHQWGYISSYNASYELWRPKTVDGTNNVNFQLDFQYNEPEDTAVTLPDQSGWVHVAEVYDVSDSNYQLKLYVNGVKVKEHYFQMAWANTLLLGGSIASASDTAVADGLVGKISDLIVTSGVKYTGTFTPARETVNTSTMTKAGNPMENFTAPEISYLEVGGIPYKIVVAS